jgi:hypothetical protein
MEQSQEEQEKKVCRNCGSDHVGKCEFCGEDKCGECGIDHEGHDEKKEEAAA